MAPPAEIEVVVAGLATVDLLVRPVDLDAPLGAGVLNNVAPIKISPGGIVSNSGITLAKLGVPTAAIAGIGDDYWGRFLSQSLRSEGIETQLCVDHQLSTPTTVVLVDKTGGRSFLFHEGCGGGLTPEAILAGLASFPQARWLLFGYYSLFPQLDQRLPELFRAVRASQVSVAMDTAGQGGAIATMQSLLPELDAYIPSYDEAVRQTQRDQPRDIIQAYRDAGAERIVGLKLGSKGAILSPSPGQFLDLPAVAPPGAVLDTTGAGDAFFAGFLAGLIRGLDCEESGRIAAAAGACCVTAMGATAGIQSWNATRQLASRQSKA